MYNIFILYIVFTVPRARAKQDPGGKERLRGGPARRILQAGLAEAPSRPSRESLKTPSRAESRVALNKTESLKF